MELSTGQKRGLFAVVVVLLAALGIFLLGPGRSHGGSPTASTSSGATPSTATTLPANLAGVPSYQVNPTTAPVPTSIKSPNIYTWLPFTQSDLDAAANVTLAFVKADETFSYTDTATGFGKRLSSYVETSLLTSLEETFQTGLPQWQQQRFTSTGAGAINSITSFGGSPSTSITFLVTITNQTTASGKTSTKTGQYDVTTVAVAGGWQVNDIEQAGQGNR
ncbi:MAG TPA: hypothetical protein VMG38_18280 [Trebonia sp.]|nr:hypothetical protein [Trebonia sp.]